MVGGGETAAAMLTELFRHRVSMITVISPQVRLFTRGKLLREFAVLQPDRLDRTDAGGAA
jgi:mycobactin lysine-N-oxygenase